MEPVERHGDHVVGKETLDRIILKLEASDPLTEMIVTPSASKRHWLVLPVTAQFATEALEEFPLQ